MSSELAERAAAELNALDTVDDERTRLSREQLKASASGDLALARRIGEEIAKLGARYYCGRCGSEGPAPTAGEPHRCNLSRYADKRLRQAAEQRRAALEAERQPFPCLDCEQLIFPGRTHACISTNPRYRNVAGQQLAQAVSQAVKQANNG